jgi:hypothetical protein
MKEFGIVILSSPEQVSQLSNNNQLKNTAHKGDLFNVQSKIIQNCHNESSMYNEYMLIKIRRKRIPPKTLERGDVFVPISGSSQVGAKTFNTNLSGNALGYHTLLHD